MPKAEDRYSATIGLSITKAENPPFADFGLRYGNLDQQGMVGIEVVFNEHADEILAAMKPLRDVLVSLGVAKAEELGFDMGILGPNKDKGGRQV